MSNPRRDSAGAGLLVAASLSLLVACIVAPVALLPAAPASATSPGLVWPATGKVSQNAAEHRASEGASAIDVYRVGSNIPIVAAAAGTVVVASTGGNTDCHGVMASSNGLGNYITLKHTTASGTTYTTYGHLASESVAVGNGVSQGQQIGVMGYTGCVNPDSSGHSCQCVAGQHVHFAVSTCQALFSCSEWNSPDPADGTAVTQGSSIANSTYPGTDSGGIPDGSLVRTPDGSIYRIAGGAPLHLSSCAPFDGCAGVIAVADLSQFATRPRDGTTIATPSSETGRIYKIAGGAPLYLSSCSADCGSPVTVNQYTIDSLDHLNAVPVNGTTIATPSSETGRIYKIAGGAPLYLSSCSADCGSPVTVNQYTIDSLDHLNAVPVNGTTIATPSSETGRIYKIAGGAPLYLSSCSADCGSPVTVNQYTIDSLDHLNAVPVNGTTIATPSSETGRIYKIAGGAPLYLSSCSADCGSPVTVNQYTIDSHNHLSASPSDGTVVRTVPSNAYYLFRDGRCVSVGATSAVTVNDTSVTCPSPRPPSRVIGVSATVHGHSVALKWHAPDNNGSALTHFIVSLSNGRSVSTPGNASGAVLKSLKSGHYSVSVTAVNSQGKGPASAAVSIRIA